MLYFEIAFVAFPLAYLDVPIAFSQMAVRVPKGSDVRSLFHNQLYAYLKPTGVFDRLAAMLLRPILLRMNGDARTAQRMPAFTNPCSLQDSTTRMELNPAPKAGIERTLNQA